MWKVKRLFVVKLSKMALIKSKSLKNPKKNINGLYYFKACDLKFTTMKSKHHIKKLFKGNTMICGFFINN